MEKTLVLDNSLRVVELISVEKAIILVCKKIATVIETYDREIRSISISIKAPKTLVLNKVINSKILGIWRYSRFSKENMLVRDGFKCQYCGCSLTKKSVTIDHVVPASKGGKTSWTNCVSCCLKCNNSKGDMSVDKAGMTLLSKPEKPDWRVILSEINKS